MPHHFSELRWKALLMNFTNLDIKDMEMKFFTILTLASELILKYFLDPSTIRDLDTWWMIKCISEQEDLLKLLLGSQLMEGVKQEA